MDEDLDRKLREAVTWFKALSPEAQAEHCRAQRESWVRAEMSWPAPKFEWINGVKVYALYEDCCND